MPRAFARAFRAPDLRRKILVTLFLIVLFRAGQTLPAPDVNVAAVHAASGAAKDDGPFALIDLFSGGALLRLSVFALGVYPYITASIVLQLLTVVVPRLEALKKEGQAGQAKITQYTRYVAVAMAVLEGASVTAMAATGRLFPGGGQDVLYDHGPFMIATMVATLVAGTCVVMWLGELITDRGIGAGMSILVFTQMVAVLPGQLGGIFRARGGFVLAAVLVCGLAIMAGVVFVEQGQRRIPVQYAKRLVGRRLYGGAPTYIPIKVNQAGVVPMIFASALLYLPQLAIQLFPQVRWLQEAQRYLRPDSPWHMAGYALLIIGFTFFYVAITFDPAEVADNMKKYGGFVPGIRPGRPTAEYLGYVLTRITAPGSAYLGLIALIPLAALALLDVGEQFPFGGTGILIVVGVGLETVKQVNAQLQQHHYDGFLH